MQAYGRFPCFSWLVVQGLRVVKYLHGLIDLPAGLGDAFENHPGPGMYVSSGKSYETLSVISTYVDCL